MDEKTEAAGERQEKVVKAPPTYVGGGSIPSLPDGTGTPNAHEPIAVGRVSHSTIRYPDVVCGAVPGASAAGTIRFG
jgi:hypothetical protein